MYTIKNQPENTGAVLSELINTIRHFNDSIEVFLHHIGEPEILNPLQNSIQIDSPGINEPIPSYFFERFGIRNLVLNAFHGRLSVPDYSYDEFGENNIVPFRWNNIKNDVIIAELKALFLSCPVIQFADWASVYNASDFWDGLLLDVIKPLNRKDFQFIFHLGDTAKKPVFEVDEILDIISDYALCGSVTLIIDENEVNKLWAVLNGADTMINTSGLKSTELREKYLSIFNAMDITNLVIFSDNLIILFSREQQYEFTGRSLHEMNTSQYAKDCFIAGYQLGLLFQFDITHCIVLGLAVSGAYIQNEFNPDPQMLLAYLKDWITELKTMTQPTKEEIPTIH